MSSQKRHLFKGIFIGSLPYIICIAFFIAYSTLSIVRHNHYQSFGYDLGINDQVVWRYSHFQLPLTTIDPFPDKTKLVTHVELVYALVAPFYWIWSSRQMLILVRTGWFCLSGIAVYLLAKKKGLTNWVSIPLVVSYLGFYGVQNDMWADVHSAEFGAAFIMWFIYFLEVKKKTLSIIFFFLAITAKENIALLTFLTAFVFFFKQRAKLLLFFMLMSIAYLVFIYFIYFPYIVQMKYLYAGGNGIFSNLNPLSLVDSADNRAVFLYSLLSFGFLPLLAPLSLLPALGDLATYFVIGNNLSGAQGLYQQYRITLTPFLAWALLLGISRFKKIPGIFIGIYLLACTALVQYTLHLPLSYLTKQWFWSEPSAVKNINYLRDTYVPKEKNASIVAQNNISPHISQRDKIYTLYPKKQTFKKGSPCGQNVCDWFRWFDNPEYLFVDTSTDWDIRHLLTDRDSFVKGLANLEKAGVIKKYQQQGNAVLYKVIKNPSSVQ